ncbi:hypothetical protein HHK36_008270 [Tetracentron sinense]|uniref:Uncharacterized protein n=1 Tax=Tetracentron sinense TaxID=13715 RepID=A0A834ZF87_TETSI|nr:hypothetical protein HHK36_008270 [Tetracentron sinense]
MSRSNSIKKVISTDEHREKTQELLYGFVLAMEMLELYSNSSLATSIDDSQVAAAREDGSLEICLVFPGSVGWHCQLRIHGNPNSRVSSLIWFRSSSKGSSRLLSSSIDGSISEWDLFYLKQKLLPPFAEVLLIKTVVVQIKDLVEVSIKLSVHIVREFVLIYVYLQIVLDSIGVSIWQIAIEPFDDSLLPTQHVPQKVVTSQWRVLSLVWSLDAKLIFSGSNDGYVTCIDMLVSVALSAKCSMLWLLFRLALDDRFCLYNAGRLNWVMRCGTLVSADSTGTVQFWDSQYGTLLQVHSCHKGDVNALAAVPSHNRVVSAGSNGQVLPYWICMVRFEIGWGNPPRNSNVLVITTSSNQIYAFDVEAKQLGQWSMHHMFFLPRRFQESPGEVIGLSFPLSSGSTSVIIYSARSALLSLHL